MMQGSHDQLELQQMQGESMLEPPPAVHQVVDPVAPVTAMEMLQQQHGDMVHDDAYAQHHYAQQLQQHQLHQQQQLALQQQQHHQLQLQQQHQLQLQQHQQHQQMQLQQQQQQLHHQQYAQHQQYAHHQQYQQYHHHPQHHHHQQQQQQQHHQHQQYHIQQMHAAPPPTVHSMVVDNLPQLTSLNEPSRQQEKPKRAMSAYNMFVKEKYRERREEPMEHKINDYAKLVGNMWADLPDTEKERYLLAAKDYDLRLGTNKADPNRTNKRAMSAYNMFVKEKYAQRRQEQAEMLQQPSDYAKVVGKMWSELPEEEKEKYHLAARESVRRPSPPPPQRRPKPMSSRGLSPNKVVYVEGDDGQRERRLQAYNYFVKEKFTEGVGDQYMQGGYADLNKMWEDLDEMHKEEYCEKSRLHEEAMEDPDKLRDSVSAYNIFLKEKYQNRQHDPQMAKLWSELTEDEKMPYIQAAADDKKRHEKDREVLGLPPSDLSTRPLHVKQMQPMMKRKVESDKVKLPKDMLPRPCKSAYVFYRMEQQRILFKNEPKLAFKECATIIGKSWKELTPEARAQYEASAAQDRTRYQREKGDKLAEYTVLVNNSNTYAKLSQYYPSTIGMFANNVQVPIMSNSLKRSGDFDDPTGKRSKSAGAGGSRMWTPEEIDVYLEVLKIHGRDYERIRKALRGSKTLSQIKSWYGNYRVKKKLDLLVPSDQDLTPGPSL